MRLLKPILAAALVALVASGCGSNSLVPVNGTLTVDGKPAMVGVRVFFSPKGDTRPADGWVVADGTFSLKTMNKPGVMPGDYAVTFTNSTESIPKPGTELTPVNGDPPKDWMAHLALVTKFLENPPIGPGWIPKVYAEHSKTPLKYTVTRGVNKATFDIESTPVKAAAAK
jgi:hypothetical protein